MLQFYSIMISKVAIILGTKFPTSKAYGVTTRETLKALTAKDIEVKVFCPKSLYKDDDFNDVDQYIANFHDNFLFRILLKLVESGTKLFNQIMWSTYMISLILISIHKIKSFKPDLIWVRDPLIALLCSKKLRNKKIVLEIHSYSYLFVFKYLIKFKDIIILAPINSILLEKFQHRYPGFKFILAPMGINSLNIAKDHEVKTFVAELTSRKNYEIKVGYIGNFAPQLYSKGIEDLIQLAQESFKNGSVIKVDLIGCNEIELKFFNDLRDKLEIPNTFLKFKTHVSHSTALKLMKHYDVLVLPEPRSETYSGMPLKLLEYLSAGRITIIANTNLFQSLFPGPFKPYFYNNGVELYRRILQVVNDKNLEEKILNGVLFTGGYTWEKRTTGILESVL